MDPQDQHTIDTVQDAINELVAACRKNGPLYRQSPLLVAQVNRNAKWLLHGLARLRRSLNSPAESVEE
jgi:hypothetical protein